MWLCLFASAVLYLISLWRCEPILATCCLYFNSSCFFMILPLVPTRKVKIRGMIICCHIKSLWLFYTDDATRSLTHMMNSCLDRNGVFQDDNVPFHLVIWKAWQSCYRISSTTRNNVWWIVGNSEEKGIRDDGVPRWSLAIILCVVATFLFCPWRNRWAHCILGTTENYDMDFFFWQQCQSTLHWCVLQSISLRPLLPD